MTVKLESSVESKESVVPSTTRLPLLVMAPQPTVPIVAIFLLPSNTNALSAAAVPAVTPSKNPISPAVIVKVSRVNEGNVTEPSLFT